jgi:hypothetical protein
MTNKTFEDHRSIEFSDHRGRSVELYVFNDEIHIETSDAREDRGGTCYAMSVEDATALKEFLIKRGY